MTFTAILPDLGLVERPAHRAVETAPGRFVDLGPERPLELVVGFVGPGEVGVADEEALAVVVGVDEPAGDVVGGAAADLPGRRVVHVHAPDLDDDLPVLLLRDLHVRLAEDHEQVARAGLLEQLVAHRQVGVHPGGQHGQLAVALRLFGDVRVEGEAADDEQVEAHALAPLPWRLPSPAAGRRCRAPGRWRRPRAGSCRRRRCTRPPRASTSRRRGRAGRR